MRTKPKRYKMFYYYVLRLLYAKLKVNNILLCHTAAKNLVVFIVWTEVGWKRKLHANVGIFGLFDAHLH